MIKTSMQVGLYKETASPIDKKDITKIANTVLRILKKQDKFTLSVAIVKESTGRTLNRIWRKMNRPPSVLSFSGQEFFKKSQKKKAKNKSFILPLSKKDYLGEIIITDSVVKRIAKARKSSYQEEFNFLFIHGLLHLLGYNHNSIFTQRKMERAEKKIVAIVDRNKVKC